MSVPDWWEALLLGVLSWRIFQLIAADTILDRPRDWALKRLREGKRRDYWHLFITCPFCLGFWLSLIVYLSWWQFPHATLVVASVALLNAVVVVIDRALDTD